MRKSKYIKFLIKEYTRMGADDKTTNAEECETFLPDVPKLEILTVLKDSQLSKSTEVNRNSKTDVSGNDAEEDRNERSLHEVVTFHVYKTRKITIKKPLIQLRIALFLWYGGALICLPFLTVFMKHKGLTLMQFSSVFSITFLFQVIVTTISGVIADKIGNAKPLLLFHMFLTTSIILSMILIPNVQNINCDKQKVNFSCFDISETIIVHDSSRCNLSLLTNNDKESPESVTINYINSKNVFRITFTEIVNGTSNERSNFSTCAVSASCNKFQENCSPLCAGFENECSSSGGNKFVIIHQILIVCFITCWSTTFRLMDVTVMFLVKKYDSHFGFERLFAVAGDFSVAILVAFAMDAIIPNRTNKNYNIVYWIASSSILLAALTVCSLKVPIKPPGKNLMKKALTLVMNLDVMSFFAVIFVLGNAFYYHNVFSFLFLEQLNAPRILFGLNKASRSVYSIPVLLLSDWWLKKFGTTKTFVVCLLFYALHAVSYSLLYNPWWSLLIESTAAVTYHLLWVSAIVHSNRIAPVGMASTLISFPGAIHYGLGRTAAVPIFGYLTHAFGQRTAYRILAAVCLTTAVLYSVFLYWRHSSGSKPAENAAESIRSCEERSTPTKT